MIVTDGPSGAVDPTTGKMLEPNLQEQIEYMLGRSLTPEELVPAASIEELTPAVRHVAELLAQRQLVLCTVYLRSIALVRIDAVMPTCSKPCLGARPTAPAGRDR
jgi:hypothetical protein